MGFKRAFLLVFSVLVFVPAVAHAQEDTPGDACAIDGKIKVTGGPEIAGAYIMLCSGGTWQNIDILSSAANGVLDIPTHTLPCTPGMTGTVRYNDTTNVLERCYGLSWCEWGSKAFQCGWQRKAMLTVNSASINVDMTSFPLLLTESNLPAEMFDSDGAYPAKDGGGDIRFTVDAAGDIPLAAEVVNFSIDPDPSLGVAEIYVKMPNLYAAADVEFYVWWSAPGINNEPKSATIPGENTVWSNAYAAVWHMNEDPNGDVAGAVLDSASTHHATPAGAMTSADLVAGKLGNAIEFDGSNDRLRPADSDPGPFRDAFSAKTYCGMVTVDSGIGRPAAFIVEGRDTNGAVVAYQNNDDRFDFGTVEDNYDTDVILSSTSTFPEDNTTWIYVCGVFEHGNMRIFINGVEEASNNQQDTEIDYHNQAPGLAGPYTVNDNTPLSNSTKPWKGKVDEVRVSTVPRSADWLALEYNNMDNPAAYVTAGTPQAP